MKNENNMLYDHPMVFAQCLARMLKADRIASGQIKEHIAQEELMEILGIEPEVVIEVETEYIQYDNVSTAVAHFGEAELLAFFKNRFTKSEILNAVA